MHYMYVKQMRKWDTINFISNTENRFRAIAEKNMGEGEGTFDFTPASVEWDYFSDTTPTDF